jgi:predicted ribosome quality control (RQC) complex YloA/Tae2 family protein
MMMMMMMMMVDRSPGGRDVYVGRNNKGNETVSHTIAGPNDLWFHVTGAPGSHTLMRMQSGEDATGEDLQFAADLACFYSRR